MQTSSRAVELLGKPENLFQASTAVLFIALFFITTTLSTTASARTNLNPNSLYVQHKQLPILELGKIVEREIAGGESHSYHIKLEAGQYLRIVAVQKGIDVTVAIFAPDDKKLNEIDSPNGSEGEEPLSVIADSAGEYRIEIRSTDKNSLARRYEVKIAELRTATEQDKTLIAAEKMALEAVNFQLQNTAESLREAIKTYRKALDLFQRLNHRKGIMDVLIQIARIHLGFGESKDMSQALNEALPISQELSNRPAEAIICSGIAIGYERSGQSEKALEFHFKTLTLWKELGNKSQEGIALSNIGNFYSSIGEYQKALQYLNQALPLRRENGVDDPTCLNNIGFIYNGLGEKEKALEYYEKALSLWRAAGNHRYVGAALQNIAHIYGSIGKLQKALQNNREALELYRLTDNAPGQAAIFNNLGGLYMNLGQTEKALDFFNRALIIRRETIDKNGESFALEHIASVLEHNGEPNRALDYLNQSLAINKSRLDNQGIGRSLALIGHIYFSLGDYRKALEWYQESLSISQHMHTLSERFVGLGLVYEKLDNPQKAAKAYNDALNASRALKDPSKEVVGLYHLARLQSKLGKFDEAKKLIESALDNIEWLRLEILNQELRISYVTTLQDYYQFYIGLLMRMHKDQPSETLITSALQASEQSRARAMLEMLVESRRNIREGTDEKLLAQELSLLQRLRDKSERQVSLLSNRASEKQILEMEKEIRALTAEYQELQAEIRLKSPRYAAITQPKPLSLAEIQKEVLDDDTLLLEFSLGDERSYLWAVAKDSLASFELPPRKEIEAAAQQFNEAISAYQNLPGDTAEKRLQRIASADQQLSLAAADLSRMLLAPAANLLGNKRLLIVPDGILHYIPFAALTDPFEKVGSRQKAVGSIEKASSKQNAIGSKQKVTSSNHAKGNGQQTMDDGQPLLVNHEIVSLPSASVLAVIRRETQERVKPPKTVAIFADPVFDENDTRVSDAKNAAAQGKTLTPNAAKGSPTKKQAAPQSPTKKRAFTQSATQSDSANHAAMRGQSPPQATVQEDSATPIKATANPAKQAVIKEASATTPLETKGVIKAAAATKPLETKADDEVENLTKQRALRSALDTRGALPRLHFSRHEAEAIYKLAGEKSGLLKLDFAANLQTALEENLAQYAIVHFSTHGILNAQQPELSGIVLSLVDEQGKRREGFLGLADIFNMKLPVELVTLSACQTALGKEIKGEGLVGLTRGFMYAGAKRVVASLWEVQDRATAKLMTDFYVAMLRGERPVVALRKAQLNLLHSRQHHSPFYWASFVLQGEWR